MPKNAEVLTEDDDDLDNAGEANAQEKDQEEGKKAAKEPEPAATEDAEGGALIELSEEFEEESGDERLQADRVAETQEQRAERRRAERKAAKERQRKARERRDRKLNEQDAVIANLTREVQTLKQGQQDGFAKVNKGQLEGAVRDIRSRKSVAEANAKEAGRLYNQAIIQKDTEAAEQALELRDKYRDEARQLDAYDRRYSDALKNFGKEDTGGGRSTQDGGAPAVSEATIAHARAFMADHPWYQPANPKASAADARDTAILTGLDNYVKNILKLDSDTKAYWEKLTELAENALPHRFDDEVEDEDDEQEEREPRRAKPNGNGAKRRAPPPSGGAIRVNPVTKKRQVFLSEARISAIKEAGHWDDPKKREKMIAAYMKHDREQGSQAQS